jgi:hypothetical protein
MYANKIELMKKFLQGIAFAMCLFGLVSYQNAPKTSKGVFVSADKMNIVQVGVDNPLSISLFGISAENILVEAEGAGATLRAGSNSLNYILNVEQQGEATITVKDKKSKSILGAFKFRSQRLPDPIIHMGNKRGGVMGVKELRAQLGLLAPFENIGIDSKCTITSYTLYHKPHNELPKEYKSENERFQGEVLTAVKNAQQHDQYHFYNIRVHCPGDKAPRELRSIAFFVR